MRLPQLDARLAAALAMVRQGSRAADVGCDHGRLALHLVLSGKCEKVYATDLRPAPLEQAKRLARRFGVEDNIEFLLADGLSPFTGDEVDDIVIAGMGGETMAGILQAAPWVRNGEKQLVLIPGRSDGELRRWLWENGFAIAEHEAAAAGRYYAVLRAHFIGEQTLYTPLEALIGKKARSEQSSARQGYLVRVLRGEEKKLAGMQNTPRLHTEQQARLVKALKEEAALVHSL